MSSDNTATERMVAKYGHLIADFVSGRVSAQNFESAYLQVFKADKDQVPSREFDVLEKLFCAIDDYIADPELREQVDGLNDGKLRARAEETYSLLCGN